MMGQLASAYRSRLTCRLCGSKQLECVLRLEPTPPANAFVPNDTQAAPQEKYPLNLFFCRACTHVQLLDIVDPEVLFRDYVYVSGTSPVFVDHFRRYVATLQDQSLFKTGDLVVEIGSNDGTFLRFFQEAGARVLGIDPAVKIANQATAQGQTTLPEFFSSAKVTSWKTQYGAADLMVANNVFAHMDNLEDVVRGVKEWMSPRGVFVFEVSYLADVVADTLFDTIYHEHLSYHSLHPLVGFFDRLGMQLFDAEKIDTHGGSIRVYAGQKSALRPKSPRLEALLKQEESAGLYRVETFRAFSSRIGALKSELTSLLQKLKSEGKKIAGFGAPAKATTLMHHFALGREMIEFIVDDSPLKQNLYSPGLHVPVLPSRAISERSPDYLILLAWNFADSIIKKNQEFLGRGGKFIVPIPQVEVRS